MARASRRAHAAQKRRATDLARSIREAERANARAARETVRANKEAQQLYVQQQIRDAATETAETKTRILELGTVLEQTLSIDDRIDFSDLRLSEDFAPFAPPAGLEQARRAPLESNYLDKVSPPRGLAKLLPGSGRRYEEALKAAQEAFAEAMAEHLAEESRRQAALEKAMLGYDRRKAAFLETARKRNAEVDDFERRYLAGEADAIVAYNDMVLERSEYPDGFPEDFAVAFTPDSQELVIDRELPLPSIVPTVIEFKYNKSKDSFDEKPRKVAEIREIYEDLVASIALRTVHEIFEADHHGAIQSVTFSGFVNSVDPSTGKDIKPYLISVRATREKFLDLDLSRVDKGACLRNLGAKVSPRPAEIQAIKPIIEFNMLDKRFVDQLDILGELESRPNLMDLSPTEFENLVSNLFGKLGLETKLTRSSRDGGVDVVAFDSRPVLGGKVIIQAKRYRDTVGVSAVRDLYGTMMNEGANKGILVTTSGYGPDAFNFAKDKPIELIAGGVLLYLLDQIGIQAKILLPKDR